jgi:hypothetical protein
MSWKGLFVVALSVVLFGVTAVRVEGQASGTVEEQLRSQYRITRVGMNGAVVGQPGSVLVVQADGITAIPASYDKYWYNTLKKGADHPRPSAIQHGGLVANGERRQLQVGEKAYIVNVEFNQGDIAFYVQSCGNCDPSAVDSNNPPFRARLAVEFDKKSFGTESLKQVQDTIAQVFKIDDAPSAAAATNPPLATAAVPATPVAAPSLKLPSTYASMKTPADHLQLNANNSFSLQESGQSYHGTFTVSGSTVELNITETGTKTNATIQGKNLTDSSGQVWQLRDQGAEPAPAQDVLRNQDIIDLVKAGFDDATILAKISASKCQFDTSTSALIQLKQNKVSPAVTKAMVSAPK